VKGFPILGISKTVIAVLALCGRPLLPCAAEEPAGLAGDTEPSVRFRRIFAPEDRLEQWPLGDTPYLRMEPAEFERLIGRLARDGSHPDQAPGIARLVRAEYRARLIDDRLREGRASLWIDHTADAPVLMPLAPCGLAIADARWKTDHQKPEPVDGRGAAQIGLGGDGKMTLLVAESGTLHFDWSADGEPTDASGSRFDLALPQCPINRLLLELPEGLVAEIEDAVPLASKATEKGWRQWHFELGGHHACRLQIVPAEEARRSAELVALGESVAYELTLQGLEIATQWRLASRGGPVDQFVLTLDNQTQLVAALQGDTPIPWSIQPSKDPGEPRRAVLTLPEPIREEPGNVLVKGLAPLVTQRLWRLPRLRADVAFWQEGRATVLVPAPLSLRQLQPSGCRQTALTPLPAPREGESLQLQLFDADAALDVLVAPSEGRLQVVSGTTLQWKPGGISAMVTADLQIRRAEQFVLHAEIPRQWILDSVETVPAEAIEDWTLAHGPKGSHRLSIRLARALAPARPLRVLVAARRLHAPTGRPLGGDDLVPLQFVSSGNDATNGAARRLEETGHWVAISTPGSVQSKLTHNADLQPIDPASLTSVQQDLLGSLPAEALVFDRSTAPRNLRIALQSERPRYSATIEVEAEARGPRLRESYTVCCTPDSVPVDRILASFSCAREAPLRWTLSDATADQQITARRLTPEELESVGIDRAVETWELSLRKPQREPLQIRGSRETELGPRQSVSLLFLPEAASQQALVTVHGDAGSLWIENRGLEPMPMKTVPAGRCQTALGAFAYAGQPGATAHPHMDVTLVHNADTPTAAVWAWSGHLQSCYGADGSAHHLATYQLESAGGTRFELCLPDGGRAASVREVWVDGEPLQRLPMLHPSSDEGPKNRLSIPLPADVRFPTVAIHFVKKAEPLGVLHAIEPPWPHSEAPVLARHWTVRLPAGYERLGADPRWQTLPPREPSLVRRILGPLARDDQPLFNPMNIRTWLPPATEALAQSSSNANARRLLQKLGSLVRPGGAYGLTSWGVVLQNPALEKLSPRLLIDRVAMANAGITPRTPIGVVAGDDPLKRGLSVLQAGHVYLLAHQDVALLTSRTQAAVYRDHLIPQALDGVCWVRPGPLAEQLREAAGRHRFGGLIPAAAWVRQPNPPEFLWAGASQRSEDVPSAVPANLYGLETPVGLPQRLRLVHTPTMRLLGAAAFLMVAALGWWTAARWPIVPAIGIGLFGATGLVVPSAWLPLTAAGVLGCLCCLLPRLVRRRRKPSPDTRLELEEPDSTATFSTPAPGAVVLLLGAAIGFASTVACGDEPSAATATAGKPVYQVFIPFDEAKQEPTGEKYYVPRDFYNQLYRNEAVLSEKPHGWLITGATYRGTLFREAVSNRLAVEEFEAIFDLQILTPGARVRIPLLRQSANLLPEGTVLDGRVIQPEWDAENEVLWFEAAEAGPCRLQVALRPTVDPQTAPSGFVLAVPPLPTARLEVSVPPGTPALRFPSAPGGARFDEPSQRWVVDLGPTDRLDVRWPEATGPTVEVDQLLWWNIQPSSVAIDTRFDLRVLEGQVDRLRVAVDPRLRLLPLSGKKAPVAESVSTTGRRQVLEFRWPGPIASETTLHATFLVTGCSGLGNFILPEIEVLDASVARRWLAVSVDTSLQYQQPPQDGRLEAVAVPDFLAAWGSTATPPQAAYRLAGESGACRIATRPRNSAITAREKLTIRLDGRHASVSFEAALAMTSGYRFQYRLRVPAALHVEEVSLIDEEGAEQMARFSQSDDGLVTVFLAGPASGEAMLSLHGRMPAPTGKDFVLPTVDLQQVEVESSLVTIFREPGVLVDMAGDTAPSEPIDTPPEPEAEAERRLVGRFRRDPREPAPVILNLKRNRPQTEAEQVVWLRDTAEGWRVQLDCRIQVVKGLLDELRIAVPATFEGPYRLDGSAGASLRSEMTSDGGRSLRVRPAEPIAGTYTFRLSGRLSPAPGEAPGVPRLVIMPADKNRTWVRLPRYLEDRPVDWKTQGLRKEPVPDYLDDPALADAHTTYRMMGKSYRAVRASTDQRDVKTSVDLADVRVAWQSDGTRRGVATFDLQVGSSGQCRLRVPPDCRLVAARLEDAPLPLRYMQDDVWRVPLGPRRLPQRLTVVFTSKATEPGMSVQRFDVPWPEDVEVARTLWTVRGPAMYDALTDELQPVPAWHLGRARLGSISHLIGKGADIPFNTSATVGRWYARWAPRFARSRRELLSHIDDLDSSDEAAQLRQVLQRADRNQSMIAEQLDGSSLLAQLLDRQPLPDEAGQLWQWCFDRDETAVHYNVDGGVGSLTLGYRSKDGSSVAERWLAALALLGMVGLAVVARRRRLLGPVFRRRPYAWGVAAGVVWWLFLIPSILGGGILLATLLIALRGRRSKTETTDGSTIVALQSVSQ